MLPYRLKNRIKEDVDIKEWTTIRTGGKVKYMFFPENIDELGEMLHYINKNGLKYYLIGNGSKVLFPDEYYDGIVINTKKFNEIKLKNEEIEVLCGYGVQNLLKFSLNNSLSGIEGLVGIPGSVGGALKMNAGSYGYEIGKVVDKVILMKNGELKEEKYKFIYRKGLNEGIFIKAYIKLQRDEKNNIKEKMEELYDIKRKTQPLNSFSFGSVFKNPEGMSAWKLIKDSGCDRLRIGDAAVSEIHSNFIINYGNARTQDILEIIKIIKDNVYKKFNVLLEEEVNIVN